MTKLVSYATIPESKIRDFVQDIQAGGSINCRRGDEEKLRDFYNATNVQSTVTFMLLEILSLYNLGMLIL
jgi:hypothetical protein